MRAGRGDLAFKGAVAFATFFALSVQWFLFRWPDWMYSYFVPASELPPGVVSPFFFVAVVAAGTVGAWVTIQLLRSGRTALAMANTLLGLGFWIAIWAATWDRYFHVGTWADWMAGTATPLAQAKAFGLEMNVAGALQGAAGVGTAAWLFVQGRRVRARSAIKPDASPAEWRGVLTGPSLQPAPGPAPITEGEIRGTSPADGRPLEPVRVTPAAEVADLVTRARVAGLRWAALAPNERAHRVKAAGKRFLERAEEAAAILEVETGRPRAESYLTELIPNADLFDHWVRTAPTALQPAPVSIDPLVFPGKRGVVERLPLGVVAVISPWNFPLALPLRTIVPALLAGNAVVLKPSEYTPRIGAFLAQIFAETLGPDLVPVVQGGAAQGQALIEAGVDRVCFVGSPRTGAAVARAAAATLTPVSLELGGKDAALVLADADLDRAANGVIWGAFANAGQNCAAIERCYVDRAIAQPFVEKLRERIAALQPGRDLGPLTTPAQRALVVTQLEEARRRGVAVRIEGDGQRLAPVLLVDPPAGLALLREETFGPVLPVIPCDGEEEMVRRANDSAYGLTASVWSRDLARAEALGRRLQAGVVTVNNHAFTGGLAQAPWGGVRGSGGGVTGGPDALHELTRQRFVLVDSSRKARELWWYPYDASALRLSRGLARLRAGQVGALGEVVGGFLGRMRSLKAADHATAHPAPGAHEPDRIGTQPSKSPAETLEERSGT